MGWCNVWRFKISENQTHIDCNSNEQGPNYCPFLPRYSKHGLLYDFFWYEQPEPYVAPNFGAKHQIRCKWWVCTDSAPKICADGYKRIFIGKLVKLHRICTYLFKFSAATLFSGPKFAKSKLNPDRNFKKTRLNPDCKSTTFCHSDWTFLKLLSLKTVLEKLLIYFWLQPQGHSIKA